MAEPEVVQIRGAWGILAQGSGQAAQSLVDLSHGARSEMVRAQAAMAVLDRVGLGRVDGVVVTVDEITRDPDARAVAGQESAAAILATRIRAMQGSGASESPGLALGAGQSVPGALVDDERVCETCGVIGELCGC